MIFDTTYRGTGMSYTRYNQMTCDTKNTLYSKYTFDTQ